MRRGKREFPIPPGILFAMVKRESGNFEVVGDVVLAVVVEFVAVETNVLISMERKDPSVRVVVLLGVVMVVVGDVVVVGWAGSEKLDRLAAVCDEASLTASVISLAPNDELLGSEDPLLSMVVKVTVVLEQCVLWRTQKRMHSLMNSMVR